MPHALSMPALWCKRVSHTIFIADGTNAVCGTPKASEARYNMLYCWAAGAQSIAYYTGESSAFAFAAAQADSITTCLLTASSSVNPSVQVSHRMYEESLGCSKSLHTLDIRLFPDLQSGCQMQPEVGPCHTAKETSLIPYSNPSYHPAP